jgi:hypothetical protein
MRVVSQKPCELLLQLWLDPSASWNFVTERTPRQNFATVLMIIAPSMAVISLRWHAWS